MKYMLIIYGNEELWASLRDGCVEADSTARDGSPPASPPTPNTRSFCEQLVKSTKPSHARVRKFTP